uniref:NadR/Ttd14 AAA domain-containing protein n=1 Tax=Pinguiococcus pyrenoidosus TaxID=172671 RepID=A0A7R9YGF8_9STRA|mmetsp:Transcript_8839/g.33377  ORF Transcript_8839/g.33377 Transcript_8839/m.33377 type:complete len:243 (+) Transcript_8839:173-901(+)
MFSRALLFGGGVAVGAILTTLARRFFKKGISKQALQSLPVFRIALTGGPCGGKSSSLAHFSRALKKKGFAVYAVPEIPTILMMGGCTYPGIEGGRKLIEFESALISLQLQAEDSFLRCALAEGKPAVIVYDRGLMDIPAYIPRKNWLEILEANSLVEADLIRRYDLVLHLVTAADGAEKFYTTGNNDARTETPEVARMLDKKVQETWSKHPNQHIVGNDGTFSDKLQDATGHVLKLVGAADL